MTMYLYIKSIHTQTQNERTHTQEYYLKDLLKWWLRTNLRYLLQLIHPFLSKLPQQLWQQQQLLILTRTTTTTVTTPKQNCHINATETTRSPKRTIDHLKTPPKTLNENHLCTLLLKPFLRICLKYVVVLMQYLRSRWNFTAFANSNELWSSLLNEHKLRDPEFGIFSCTLSFSCHPWRHEEI